MFQDLSLTDLSSEMRSRLQEPSKENWFSSMGFAESYCFPPAERVCFLEGASGEILEKCFYRERRCIGLFKRVDVVGPVDPQGGLLRELQSLRDGSLVHTHWIGEAQLPRDRGTWRTRTARRIGEDCCIDLPQDPSDYAQSLGSKARKHLPYYTRRLQREWGNEWVLEHQGGAGISREAYDRLLDLNGLRMRQKGQLPGWTQALRDHRWILARDCGLLCSINYRGQIVGGTFSFLHKDEAYLIVIAHDPQFDRLNLGSVSLWLTIHHLIEAGYKRYHLMWGRSFYKEQFGARENPLYRLTIFANPFVGGVWHIANLLSVQRAWSLGVKIWRRLSWNLTVSGVRKRDSASPKKLLVSAPPVRVTRD